MTHAPTTSAGASAHAATGASISPKATNKTRIHIPIAYPSRPSTLTDDRGASMTTAKDLC
ncbi:hypothetical protein U91I_00300 [alpha proteobacterium U9-1i]|nr:hypothetical protein U91I_00300 [alpha proteobacterium U9-1i]